MVGTNRTVISVTSVDRIALITLNRPPVNAASIAMYEELLSVLAEVGARQDIYVVIVRSALDGIFCAGADIRELAALVTSETLELHQRRQELARQTYDALLTLPQPTIAVINGAALGAGAVFAACCDIRYGAASTSIGLTEINVAQCGGGRHLMRLIGQGLLREMYFTGEPLSSTQAYRAGLLNRVFPDGEELDGALELANRIASKSPTAIRLVKEALNGSESLPVDEGYAFEQSYTRRLARHPDAAEATRAFLEKRPPVWQSE